MPQSQIVSMSMDAIKPHYPVKNDPCHECGWTACTWLDVTKIFCFFLSFHLLKHYGNYILAMWTSDHVHGNTTPYHHTNTSIHSLGKKMSYIMDLGTNADLGRQKG